MDLDMDGRVLGFDVFEDNVVDEKQRFRDDTPSHKTQHSSRTFGTDLSRSSLANRERGTPLTTNENIKQTLSALQQGRGEASRDGRNGSSYSQKATKTTLPSNSMRVGSHDNTVTTPRRKLDMGARLDRTTTAPNSLSTDRYAPNQQNPVTSHRKTDASLSSGTVKSTNRTPMTSSSLRSNGSISARNDIEFDAHFAPGPIGLKLEPVIKRMGIEHGCRVADFTDIGPNQQSQARQLGTIKLGDVILAVDNMSVSGKSYRDIMAMLKRPAPHEGRSIRFRRAQNSPSLSYRSGTGSVSKEGSNSSQNRLNRISTTPYTLGVKSLIGSAVSSLSNKSNWSQKSLHTVERVSNDIQAKSLSADMNQEKNPRQQTPSNLTQSSTRTPRSSPLTTQHQAHENTLFSPSHVKKLSQQKFTQQNNSKSLTPMQQQQCKPLTGVMQGTQSVKEMLGKTLFGSTSHEFDQAISLKRQLLTELSEAKAALGENEEQRFRLEKTIEELKREKAADKEKAEVELTKAKQSATMAELKNKQKDSRLAIVSNQHAVEVNISQDRSTHVTKLAAQNGFLSASIEQLKLQSDEKEKRLTESVAKMQLQLDEKLGLIESLQGQIERLRDEATSKEDKLEVVTRELNDQTIFFHKLKSDLMEKEMALDDAKSNALRKQADGELRMNEIVKKKDSEMRSQVEELETIARQARLQKVSLECDLKDIKKDMSAAMDRLVMVEEQLKKEVELKKNLETKIEELEAQLSESHERLNSSRTHSTFQDAEITKIQKLVTDLTYDKQQISDELEKFKAEAAESSKEFKSKEDELTKEASNQRSLLSEAQNALQQQQKDSQNVISKLQQELSDLKKDNEKLAEERSATADRMKHLEEETEESSKVWKQMEEELSLEVSKQQSLVSEAQNALKQEQNDLQAEMANMQQQMSDLEKENKELAKERSKVSDQLKNLESETSKSTKVWKQMEDELTIELQQQHLLVEEKEAELKQQKLLRQEKQQEIDELIGDVNSLQEKISYQQKKMDSEYAEVRMRNNELRVSLSEKDKEVEKLKKEMKHAKNNFKESINQLKAEKNSTIESITRTANENEKRVIETLTMVDDRESMIEELESKFSLTKNKLLSSLSEKEDELQRIESDNNRQRDLVGEIISKIANLDVEATDSKSGYEYLSGDLEKDQMVRELEDAIKCQEMKFRSVLSAKGDEIVQLKMKNEKIQDDLMEVCQSKEQLVVQLHSELSTYKERLSQLESDREKEKIFFQTTIKESREKAEGAEQRAADTIGELREMNEKVSSLESEIRTKCSKLDLVTSHISAYQPNTSLDSSLEQSSRLLTKVEIITQLIGVLNCAIEEAKANASAASSLASDKEKLIAEMKKSTSAQILDLDNQITSFKELLQKTESCKKEFEDKYLVIKESLEKSEMKASAAEKVATELEDDNSKLIAEVQIKSELIQEMEEIKRDSDIVMKEQESLCTTLQENLQTANRNMSSIQKLAEVRERRIVDLEEEVESLSTELQGVVEQNGVLEDCYARAKSSIERLQGDIDDLQVALDDRANKIEGLEEDLADKKDVLKSKVDEAKMLRDEISSLTLSENEAKSTIEALEKKYFASEESLALSQKSLKKHEEHRSKLEDELILKENESISLAEQITNIKSHMSKLSSEYEIATSAKNELELKCKMLEDKVRGADTKASKAENLAEEREEKLVKAEKDLEIERQDVAAKDKEISDLSNQISNLESEAAKLELARDGETLRASQAHNTIDSLEHELKSSKNTVTQLTAEIDTIRKKFGDSCTDYESKISTAESNKKELKSKCDALETSVKKAQDEILTANESTRKVMDEVEQMKADLNEKSAKIATLSHDVKKSGDLLKHKSVELQSLQNFISQFYQKHQVPNNNDLVDGENSTASVAMRIINELETKNAKLLLDIENSHIQFQTENTESNHMASPSGNNGGVMSPACASLLSKHHDMLDAVKKMKSEMTESLSSETNTGNSDGADSHGEIDKYEIQMEEKDRLIESMKKRVDSLVHDLTSTKSDLDQQVALVQSMTHSNNNMRCYIEGVEQTLGRELTLRRLAEGKLKAICEQTDENSEEDDERMNNNTKRSEALMKAGAARIIFQTLDRKAKSQMGRAFRQWMCKTREGAVLSNQIIVAREMAHQLETTKRKLDVLKCHFNEGVEVQDGCMMPENEPCDSTVQDSSIIFDQGRGQNLNSSSFWDISDDDATLNDSHCESINI